MKTKNEIYVVVDTPKKAKKLKAVLRMFGEPIYPTTNDRLSKGVASDEYPTVAFLYDQWMGDSKNEIGDKTKVSIKELRNILAVEHLKEGDVVILGVTGTKYLVNYDKFFNKSFLGKSFRIFHSDGEISNCETGGGFSDFIRYATEEEKELLEPKKELVVGKWYKKLFKCGGKDGYILFCYNGTVAERSQYGFNHSGKWSEILTLYANELKNYVEATPEEVEKALIAEAKRRGYVDGVTIKSNRYSYIIKFKEIRKFKLKENSLQLHADAVVTDHSGDHDYKGSFEYIFKDGQWAEIIEVDMFAALKKAHAEGAVIQYRINSRYAWVDCINNTPVWVGGMDYRVKPFEQRRVKVISGGKGAYGADGLIGYTVERENVDFEKYAGCLSYETAPLYIKTLDGYYWGLCDGYNIEELQDINIGDWVSYKSGDIPKVTKITERNLDHYRKHKDAKVIEDKGLINKLNNL